MSFHAPPGWADRTTVAVTPEQMLVTARRGVLRAPQAADAQMALGLARMQVGHWDHAVRAFAAAVRLAPGDADAWAWLGTARMENANPDGADVAFRRALLLSPFHALATTERAGLMRTRGDVDAAEAALRAALTATPAEAGDAATTLRVALAGALLQDQRGEEVLALLSGAPPAHDTRLAALWHAHRSAALHLAGEVVAAGEALAAAPAPPPPGVAATLTWRRVMQAAAGDEPASVRAAAEAAEAALGLPGETTESRIVGHFNLARFWSRRDERARAFAHWQAAHALLRPLQPFSRARFAAFVETSERVFDAARLLDGPRASNDDPTPVFIVGMPRSGTTLVEQILAAHPQVHGAGERSALAQSAAAIGDGEAEADGVIERMAAVDRAAVDAAAVSYLAELHERAPGAARIVDKMPGNFRLLGYASLLLPGARFIHCVRDPRDIGFSIYTLRFFGHHAYAHDLAELGWYIGMQQRLMAHWSSILRGRILRVHLHDWIDDLPGTLARVLDFIGLPYDAACERFFELDREVRTASREQVRRPVNRDGLGRWRDYADHLGPLIKALQATGALAGR